MSQDAPQPPDVLALVVADGILRDPLSGKCFIQGTYSVILAPGFPYTFPSLVLYAAVTDIRGKTAIKVRLVDVDEKHDPVFEAETQAESPDPLAVMEIVFGKRNVTFLEPGEYRLQLYGAGEFLKERRLHVLPAQPADDASP